MVFDGHSDIFTDVTLRSLAGESDILNTYHLKRLKKGNIEGGIFVIWNDPPYDQTPYERNMQILQAINTELKASEHFTLVKTMREIKKAKTDGRFYILLGMEGLAGIGEDLSLLEYFYNCGVRHAMLTWNEQNQLATGVSGNPERGLTSIGKKAVQYIQNQKMLLDVSHLNETSFWDVISVASKPVIASHSNAKSLCNVPRNLSDEQLRNIRDLDGIIGLNAYHAFVSTSAINQNIVSLADHMVYMAGKIGPEYLGFGFDFFEFLPDHNTDLANRRDNPSVDGLENCGLVPNLIDILKNRGFSKSEIDGFCYRNWHRVIETVLN